MTSKLPSHCLRLAGLIALLAALTPARAQISLTTAVDLALRNNPRVRLAEADVDKARAVLSETRDVYIPNLVGGSGLGYSYGFPLGQPTLFNFQAQSLVFSYSQRDYIRAARAGLEVANFALRDTRQAVAEDTVLTYIALDRDSQRLGALKQQYGSAARLITVVQDRVDAGQDPAIDLTSARLTSAQIHLAQLRAEDEEAIDRVHLAHLTGLPPDHLATVDTSIPEIPTASLGDAPQGAQASPAVQAAFANAHAKREAAFGDARYRFRPQVAFAAQYSRFSTFNNYQEYYGRRDANGNSLSFQYNAVGIGIQIQVPFYDRSHESKARESAADAAHAQHDAEQILDQFTEGRLRVERSTLELAAREEVATLDQKLAQQQLEALLVQLNAGNPNGPQMTPKDEQNSRIVEREKYLSVVDARFQTRQARVNLLRQTGELEAWLKSAAHTQP